MGGRSINRLQPVMICCGLARSRRKLAVAMYMGMPEWDNVDPFRALSFFRRMVLAGGQKRRVDASRSTLFTVIAELKKAKSGPFDAIICLLNVGLYFFLADMDIQCAQLDIVSQSDPWRQKLSARVIILAIYELDFDKATGSDLRKAFEMAGIPRRLRREFAEALVRIRLVNKDVRAKYGHLRKSVLAHRDRDALAQYLQIEDLDVQEVLNIANQFYDAMATFFPAYQRAAASSSTWPAFLKQWAYHEKAGTWP